MRLVSTGRSTGHLADSLAATNDALSADPEAVAAWEGIIVSPLWPLSDRTPWPWP